MSIVAVFGKDKAKYKQLTLSWVKGVFRISISTLLVVALIKFNQFVINLIFRAIASNFESGGENGTFRMYNLVRERAYSIEPIPGIIGTIMYAFLIYYAFRFAIMYLLRMVYIYKNVLLGLIIPVIQTFQEIAGKKVTIYEKWYKDLVFNIFIQLIHAIIFSITIPTALAMSGAEGKNIIFSLVFTIIIMKYMLELAKEFRKLFGLDKNDSGMLSKVMDSVTPVQVMNMAANLKPVKEGVKWFTGDGRKEATEKLKESAFRNTYNNYQRIKEISYGLSGRKLNGEYIESDSDSNDQDNLNPQTSGSLNQGARNQSGPVITANDRMRISDTILQINKNANDEISNIAYEYKNERGSMLDKFASLNPFLGLDMSKYVETDELGRKRLLKGELYYDKKSNKFKRRNAPYEKIMKDIKEDYDLKDIKEAIEVTKDTTALLIDGLKLSSKVGLLMMGSPFAAAGLKEAGVAYSAVFGSKILDTDIKKMKKSYSKMQEERRKAGFKVPGDGIVDSYEAFKARRKQRLAKKLEIKMNKLDQGSSIAILDSLKRRKKLKLKRMMKKKKLKFNAIEYSSLDKAINSNNATFIRSLGYLQKFKDVGNIKLVQSSYIGRKFTNNKFFATNRAIIDRRKEENAIIVTNANVKIAAKQLETRRLLGKVLGVSTVKDIKMLSDSGEERYYSKMDILMDTKYNEIESMQEVIKTVDQIADFKAQETLSSARNKNTVSRYIQVMNELNSNPNNQNNLELANESVKLRDYIIEIGVTAVYEEMAQEEISKIKSDVTDAKVQEIFKEKYNLDISKDIVLSKEIKARFNLRVDEILKTQQEIIDYEKRNNIVFEAENTNEYIKKTKIGRTKKIISENKGKKVRSKLENSNLGIENITLDELIALKKDTVLSMFEADRVAENEMILNYVKKEVQTNEQIRFLNNIVEEKNNGKIKNILHSPVTKRGVFGIKKGEPKLKNVEGSIYEYLREEEAQKAAAIKFNNARKKF